MGYRIVDCRSLASLWYNEFLPERVGDRAAIVEDAGVIYLKPIPLESVRRDTIEFMLGKMADASGGDIGLFVQEPRPVDNVRLQPLLKFIDKVDGLSQERKDKVLHYANRRYVPSSASVVVPQDKEIDTFLSTVFEGLSRMEIPQARVYQIRSLGVSDFIDSARAFFPKKSLSIQSVPEGKYVQVRSTNEMLEKLNRCAVNGELDLSATMERYLGECKQAMERDIEGLV